MILKSSQIGISSKELSVRSLIFFIVELENLINYIRIQMLRNRHIGFLHFSFSQMKDASIFFKGGMIVFNQEQKVNLLKIHPEEAEITIMFVQL